VAVFIGSGNQPIVEVIGYLFGVTEGIGILVSLL
jgi:hypothetical protein